MKIGQEVEFKTDFKIKTALTGKVLEVKQGDKAIATRTGFKILTGEGKGKITNYQEGQQIKGYDYRNISNLIFDRLNCVYGLEEFMDCEDIKESEMIDEIEDVLMDIF